MVEDTPLEHCFRTITRGTVDQSDDDEDDDDDEDAPVGTQVTRECCKGWYTPEGKPLCSGKKQDYVEQTAATKCEQCDKLDKRLTELEEAVKSTRGSVGYLFIRYLKEKISSLEKANKKQEEKIMYLEERMENLTGSGPTVTVVEFTSPSVERSASLSAVDPCEAATCPDHPEAMCMVTSRCGRDIAVFVDQDINTVNCDSTQPCNLLPPSFCPDDPCMGITCDTYPNAICVVTECDCKPSFMLQNRSVIACNNEQSFAALSATSFSDVTITTQ